VFEIFGIPSQALLSLLLLGAINGSFYAMMSLGLACSTSSTSPMAPST
jgi:branched-chain amino acid transport system permease protein